MSGTIPDRLVLASAALTYGLQIAKNPSGLGVREMLTLDSGLPCHLVRDRLHQGHRERRPYCLQLTRTAEGPQAPERSGLTVTSPQGIEGSTPSALTTGDRFVSLIWTRERDGEHNGKPCYEYRATCEDRTYHIVWACDRGGVFGFTAVRQDAQGYTEYLPLQENGRAPFGITWLRTLKRCKSACEQIDAREMMGGR